MFPHDFDKTGIAHDLIKDNVSVNTYAGVRFIWEKYKKCLKQNGRAVRWMDNIINEINNVMDDINAK